jgi:putative ABC transport system ATP-binding protein
MITLHNLAVGYGKTPVARLPDTHVAQGGHCLITGKSGSGKTTLLYALAGLLTPLEGRITIGGTDITALAPRARDAFRGAHIGIVFQTLHMVAALSLLDNVLLAQYAAGLAQQPDKAEALLAQLGLFDHRHRKPGQLSQGQKQRAAIARAAINRPSLIIADEPTSALDDESAAACMDMLLRIAGECHASLIVATHDARIKPCFTQTLALGGVS